MQPASHLKSRSLKIVLSLILQTSVLAGMGQILPNAASAQNSTSNTDSFVPQVHQSTNLPSNSDGTPSSAVIPSEDLPVYDDQSISSSEEVTGSTEANEGSGTSDLQKVVTASKLIFEAFEKILNQ